LPLTVGEARTVIRATADTGRLLQLDDIWTAAAAGGPPAGGSVDPDEWVDQVEGLVDEMHGLLKDVGGHAGFLAALAEQHAEEAEVALNDLLWGNLLTQSDREDLRWWAGRHGGFSAMAAASASLLAETDQEHMALDYQLERLQSGVMGTGDLSKKFLCGSAQQLMVGGVLLVPGAAAGGVTAGLAAGAVAGVAIASTGGLAALAVVGAALWWARRHRC
jgi:hypothetical protein